MSRTSGIPGRLALLAAAALVLTACTPSNEPARSDASPSASPASSGPSTPATTPPATPTDPPSASTTPEPTEPTLPTPPSVAEIGLAGEADVVAFVGRRVVVATPRAVSGYDLRGRRVWTLKRELPSPSRVVGTSETDGVVLVTWDKPEVDRFYPPVNVRALDARTGAELWRDDTASYGRAAGGAVFTSLCSGEQDRHVGDCTVSARDPRTGATRWSVDTYASARVPRASADALMTESYPGQSPPSWRVRDLATGAAVSPEVQGEHTLEAEFDGFTEASLERRPGPNGCRTTVRHRGLDGEVAWTRRLRVGMDPNFPGSCTSSDTSSTVSSEGGPIPVVSFGSTSRVLDRATGDTLLTVDKEHTLLLVTDGIAVVAEGPLGYEGRGAGVSLRTGRPLWQPGEGDYEQWTLVGDHALRTLAADEGEGCVTEDVDLRSGTVRRSFPGGFAASGPGWVAMQETCDVFGGNDSNGAVTVYRLRGADRVTGS